MSFAERLKKARKKAGITQKEIAIILGTSPQNYAQYESAKRTPKKETLDKIAEALNMGYSFATNGEPYFYTFVDTANTSEQNTNAFFNKMQLFDADPSAVPIDKKELKARQKKHEDYIAQLTDEIFVQMLNEFLELNDSGQQEALKRISELKEISKYKKTDSK